MMKNEGEKHPSVAQFELRDYLLNINLINYQTLTSSA
jgi:hypothetical protein